VGNRALRVLVYVFAAFMEILFTLRVFRVARIASQAGLVAGILVAGYLLLGPLLTIPRFTTEGPVVRNGVAAVMVCGKKSAPEGSGRFTARETKGLDAATKYAPEPRTGGWWPVRKGECTVWYHRPPDATQRYNRHERAQQEGYSP